MLYENTCIELDLPLEEDAMHRTRDGMHEMEANEIAAHKTLSDKEKLEKLENFHGKAKERFYKRAAKTISGHINRLKTKISGSGAKQQS